jgi:hypothetical protein
VFFHAVFTPLIGNRNDAEAIKEICFENGASAFNHQGIIFWDEKDLLDGESMWNRGNQEEMFHDLLEMNSEPYMKNGEIQKLTVKMPIIEESGDAKVWKG